MKKIILLLFLSLTTITQLKSQWVQTGGPNGGYTSEIVKVGSVLLVSAVNGGVYKSLDNGASWHRSSSGLPVNEGVQHLLAHNGFLYASISRSGIYFSEDEGANWIPINAGIENLTFYSFIVEGEQIFAGNANGGVYYSPDNGASWFDKSDGISGIQFQDFTFFNGAVYAGGSSLFKSTNQGNSWEQVEVSGLGANGVRSMVTHGEVFYVANDGNVFVSTDNLSSWRKSTLNTYATIKTMGVAGDSVYLTTSGGRFYFTKDAGVNWTLVQNSLIDHFVNDVYFLEEKILMSSQEGIYVSFDGGDSWALNNNGINALSITSLESKGDDLFAGTDFQGIFRSADGGENWQNVSNGLDALNAKQVSEILVVEEAVFIGTGGGVYASFNDGHSWELKLDPGVNKSVNTLGYDKGNLVAGVNGTGIFISSDIAESWSLAETAGLATETSYESIVVTGDTIAVSTHNGEIFLSEDLGNSWSDISISGGFYFTYKLKFSDDKLYAATARGLLVSEDLGNNWGFVSSEQVSFYDVIIQEAKLYAATNIGVLVSTEQREEWYDRGEGLHGQSVKEIMLNDGTLYAGTFASSVWQRPLGEIKIPALIVGLSSEIVTPEDTSVTLSIENLEIDAPDHAIPGDFIFKIKAGDNYSINENFIVPAQDFYGFLQVPVTINDGEIESPVFEVNIEVTPVNDPPVITAALKDFVTPKETSIEISLADLEVEDPDNRYPNGFTLQLLAGENYTIDAYVVTPAPDFVGTLTVPVVVNDGAENSPVYEIVIKVNEITGLAREQVSGSLKVFPNPSTDKITFVVHQDIFEKAVLQLYNLKGELVFSKDYKGLKANTDYFVQTKNTPSGMYMLSLSTAKGIQLFHKVMVR